MIFPFLLSAKNEVLCYHKVDYLKSLLGPKFSQNPQDDYDLYANFLASQLRANEFKNRAIVTNKVDYFLLNIKMEGR